MADDEDREAPDVVDNVIDMAASFDPVGESEIAERLGVLPTTVHQWRYRGLLPEPGGIVSGNPVWNWRVIERWAKKTDRLPEPPEITGACA